MPRSFATEHPEFVIGVDIPVEFMDTAKWTDESWHNDGCPHFVTADVIAPNVPFRISVWVERLEVGERECESLPRFGVEVVTADDYEQYLGNAPVIDCETMADVYDAIAELSGFMKGEAV